MTWQKNKKQMGIFGRTFYKFTLSSQDTPVSYINFTQVEMGRKAK